VGEDEHLVFVANADGTNERELALPAYSGPARVSTDGTRILLFTGDGPNSATGKGATVGIDGSGYTVLPISDQTLNYVPQIWSPDGSRIAFECWDTSKPSRNGIYTARTKGGDIVRVTSHDGPHDIPADYSPNGTQIVFYRAALEEPEPWDLGGALWVVNVDGSGARRIETPGVMPSPGARWSPDGTKILFSTARAQQTGALWTVNADGSNLTRIFQDTDPNYAYGRYATGPVWSPDGSQIMFTLNPIADWFQHPRNGIYVINADGTGLAEVIGSSDFKTMAEWWP
jgi:Tol biopolymer transport system component